MSKIQTISLCDDHPFTAMGLKFILEQAGFRVISKYSNGIIAFNQILMDKPDLIITDFDMPGLDGIELIKKLQSNGCKAKTIVCTAHNNHSLLTKAIQANVDGYLLKSFDANEILLCIKKIELGEKFFSKELVNQSIVNSTENNFNQEAIKILTSSEKKILRQVGLGRTNNEITNELFLSGKTVEVHRRNIIKKLNLPSYRNALSNWAKAHLSYFQYELSVN